MKNIFKIRTGGMFHGTTYIIVADNKIEAIKIMLEKYDEDVSDDEIEQIILDKSRVVASGQFYWLYHQ